MSYSALYLLPEGGHMIEDSILYAEYRNSWGLGMCVWSVLWEKYCRKDPRERFGLFDLQPVWDLQNSPDLEDSDKFVLYSTFDGCIIRSHAVDLLACSYEAFDSDHKDLLEEKVWHGHQIAQDLRKAHAEHPDKDVFLMMTSVSGIVGYKNPFYFPLYSKQTTSI